jgi:UDP-glucose:(heptosyl)LPS alpha-1,3-glucosyltransferase
LRLAVVSPFVDRRHGTERALTELLERLARDQHCEIHLYSQSVEDLELAQPSVTQTGGSGAIIWHKVPSIPGPHFLRFLAWLLLNSLSRTWGRWIHGLRFDLVLSPGINCLDADVVIVHAIFHRLQELANEEAPDRARPGLLRQVHRRVYYAFLAGLERRIYMDPKVSLAAVSHRAATLLKEYFRRQDVHIIPNGVDTAQFSPSSRLALRAQARRRRSFQESDFVLLLIGNDWRVKGLETILRAMNALRDLPIFVLAAGGDSPDSFREKARSLGILERCRFEPPRENVLDFYAAADLYVSPTHEDSFGMPVAEAMACGLPAITSVFAGISSLLHDGVDSLILRDPHDAKTLATMIRTFYQRAEWRSRMEEAAAKTSLEWTWDRNAAAVWELLRNVAVRKRRAPARKT